MDLPALGKPTKPTSARDLNSSLNDFFSPSKPGVNFLGAWFVLDLNQVGGIESINEDKFMLEIKNRFHTKVDGGVC